MFLLFTLAFAVWRGLNSLEPQAEWLKVEAPQWVKAGGTLPLRLHLAPQKQPCKLNVDLNWSKTHNVSEGLLSIGGTKAVGLQGGSFDFNIPVPPKNGIRYVKAVIYLSPNGKWYSHTQAATTDYISVQLTGNQIQVVPMKPLKVEPLKKAPEVRPRSQLITRLPVALLFLMTAILWHKGLSSWANKIELGATNRFWHILTVALLFACLWELFNLETVLGDKARALARAGDFYYSRAIFQKAIISTVAAATVLFLAWLVIVRHPCRFWLACFGIYLGLATVNLLSLHAVDSVLALAWHDLTLIQSLKMVCAALTLYGIRRALVASRV